MATVYRTLFALFVLCLAGCGGGDQEPSQSCVGFREIARATQTAALRFSESSGIDVVSMSFSLTGNSAVNAVRSEVAITVPVTSTGARTASGFVRLLIDGATVSEKPFSLETVPGGSSAVYLIDDDQAIRSQPSGVHSASLQVVVRTTSGADDPANITAGQLIAYTCN